jgi:penicillin-insensitive murein endopeptidase
MRAPTVPGFAARFSKATAALVSRAATFASTSGATTSTAAALAWVCGCASVPSPLAPEWHGSIGSPNRGVLFDGAELRADAPGLRWLRHNDRHWGATRFTAAIERAAEAVVLQRPPATLRVGDLSAKSGGGPFLPHFSHRSGLDADLLLYVTTPEGAPVDSPGFVHFGADGLARDEARDRWLRLDVEREWLLVKALLEDPEARVQWIFVSDVIEALLTEWAMSRGDSLETIARAEEVMVEPHPGGVHDDHIHVRSACSPQEVACGCELVGPRRSWLSYDLTALEERTEDLVLALLLPPQPIETPPPNGEPAPSNLPTASHGTSTP